MPLKLPTSTGAFSGLLRKVGPSLLPLVPARGAADHKFSSFFLKCRCYASSIAALEMHSRNSQHTVSSRTTSTLMTPFPQQRKYVLNTSLSPSSLGFCKYPFCMHFIYHVSFADLPIPSLSPSSLRNPSLFDKKDASSLSHFSCLSLHIF